MIKKMNTVAAAINKPAAPAIAGKYLTFTLGAEGYGLPALKVREIIRHVPPTVVPQLPEHIRGVINLRGKIIPVVDLRLKLGFPAGTPDERTCIVVVQVQSGTQGVSVTGMIVDGVEEVVQITMNEIEPAPDFGAGLDTVSILGIAKMKDGVKTLLNIDHVLAATAKN